MEMKIGDRVKFLNQTGGGIISKIISPSMVKVSIEDGFEIPTMVSELLKLDSTEKSSVFFTKQPIQEQKTVDVSEEESVEKISPLLNRAGYKSIPKGVYMVFHPHNQKWLITGLLDIFIVNNTDYQVLYSYFLSEDNGLFTGMDFDVIPDMSKVYLQTIDRNEVGSWNKGLIQLLFHDEGPGKVLLPASSNFDIKESRFIKEDNYKDTSLIEGKALYFSLLELSKQGNISGNYSETKQGKHETEHIGASQYKEAPIIDKHRISPGTAEVDLHIEELVADGNKIDTEQILKIQLDYFTRTLESAIANKYFKVIFIHGVGNGTLKSEIKFLLDTYEGLNYTQASQKVYGVGAIEVNILHK
jgi:hypothetical protein